ncbi:MAG: hypothetical protein Q8K75_10805 [Chlamydiales bacterium]|nr:hypothetical protein [Chlamydiales bacterium]
MDCYSFPINCFNGNSSSTCTSSTSRPSDTVLCGPSDVSFDFLYDAVEEEAPQTSFTGQDLTSSDIGQESDLWSKIWEETAGLWESDDEEVSTMPSTEPCYGSFRVRDDSSSSRTSATQSSETSPHFLIHHKGYIKEARITIDELDQCLRDNPKASKSEIKKILHRAREDWCTLEQTSARLKNLCHNPFNSFYEGSSPNHCRRVVGEYKSRMRNYSYSNKSKQIGDSISLEDLQECLRAHPHAKMDEIIRALHQPRARFYEVGSVKVRLIRMCKNPAKYSNGGLSAEKCMEIVNDYKNRSARKTKG